MNFLKRLSALFTGHVKDHGDSSFWITVQCDHCAEVIRTRIDMINDLSAEYGEGETVTAYFCRKVLIGKERCFRPIEVMLKFDAHRKLIDRQIAGGKFLPG